jgi:D-alanyl-D-alanine carboxypeptidase/D-alanyl-D-alanine-endopeptidase (penicillin-binding protein 4)
MGRGACQKNWRGTLAIDLSDPTRPRFRGTYPASCGDREWPLAYPDPGSFNARAIEAQWQALGGRLQGQVREGRVPPGLPPLAAWPSPSLPDVLRDMNKHSNNMVAQHVMLALSPGQPDAPATFETARAEVQRLVQAQGCREDELVVDNGSGLSRQERVSARCLGRLFQWAWTRPWMPDFLGSLPVAGIETTARRLTSAAGRAHVKTGTLGNVVAIGGVVDDASGRRHAVVAMINHPQAGSPDSRAVLDTVLRWALRDAVVNSPQPPAAPETAAPETGGPDLLPAAADPELRTDCCGRD